MSTVRTGGAPLLALDGALGVFSVALLCGDREIARSVDRGLALERGLALVDEVLAEARMAIGEIELFAVGTGPGGFSGLRIALSYAKALALAVGRPLAGVDSYDAVEPPRAATPVVAAVTGRQGLACARLRPGAGPALQVWCATLEATVEALAGALEGVATPITCCGNVEGVAERLGERGFTVRAIPMPCQPALAVAKLAACRPLDAFGTPHSVVADYGFAGAGARDGDITSP